LNVSTIRASDISTIFSLVSPFGVEEEEFTLAADAIKKLIDDKKLQEQELEEKRKQEEKAKLVGMGDHLRRNKGDKSAITKKETAMKRRKREEDSEDNDNENKDNNIDINVNTEKQLDTPNNDTNNYNDDNEKASDIATTTNRTTKKKGIKTKKATETPTEEILIDKDTNTQNSSNIIKDIDIDNDDDNKKDKKDDDTNTNEVTNNNDTNTNDDDEMFEKKKKKKKIKKRINNDIDITELVQEATSSLSSSFRQKISTLEQLIFDQNKSVEELR
jgi:hypothetical protein